MQQKQTRSKSKIRSANTKKIYSYFNPIISYIVIFEKINKSSIFIISKNQHKRLYL